MLDFIPDGKVLINQADVLLVSSQEWESFGWTVIEAMVRGVPVVSTNSGGLAEVIGSSGTAGFCVDPRNIELFAKHVIDLLTDFELRAAIIESGRKRVADLFTVEKMALNYADLVRNLD